VVLLRLAQSNTTLMRSPCAEWCRGTQQMTQLWCTSVMVTCRCGWQVWKEITLMSIYSTRLELCVCVRFAGLIVGSKLTPHCNFLFRTQFLCCNPSSILWVTPKKPATYVQPWYLHSGSHCNFHWVVYILQLRVQPVTTRYKRTSEAASIGYSVTMYNYPLLNWISVPAFSCFSKEEKCVWSCSLIWYVLILSSCSNWQDKSIWTWYIKWLVIKSNFQQLDLVKNNVRFKNYHLLKKPKPFTKIFR